jgi:hypothetical protein
MKCLIVVLLSLSLFACAAGPVQMAKNEQEGIKVTYGEAQLRTLYEKNKPLLHDIYVRLTRDKVDVYKEGIGFTTLKDEVDVPHYYLMVNVRPPEIVFDQAATKAEQRFSKVVGTYGEKYLKYVKKGEIEAAGAEGLALGLFWPVRDYSQCREAGGFIEYVLLYLTNDDVNNIKSGNKSYAETVSDSEVIASLDMKKPTHYIPVFE